MEAVFRQGFQSHFFQQLRKGKRFPGFFLGEVERAGEGGQNLAGLFTAQTGAAENVFIHVGEEPGMDGADVTEGVFSLFFDYPAETVRIQQVTVPLRIQPEVPGTVFFPDHGPAQIVSQFSRQLTVVRRRIFIDVDFPHLAASVAAGSSFAGKIVEPFR